MGKSYLLTFLLLTTSLLLLSQKNREQNGAIEQILYGRIGPELLSMSSYEEDPEAPAVVLSDIGTAKIGMLNSKRTVHYIYHRRIKYFSKGPEDWAEVSIPFDISEVNLVSVKAATYNPNSDGDPITFEVPKRSIEVARVGGTSREVRFRFPLIKEGSVAEYLVEFSGNRLNLLRPWVFQQKWPVARSEFHLVIPQNYSYQVVPQGDTRNLLVLEVPFSYNPTNSLQRGRRGRGEFGNYLDGTANNEIRWGDIGGSHRVFLMEEVPALVDEAFSTQNQNLLPGLRFQLANSPDFGSGSEGVFDRWKQLERYVKRKTRPQQIKADERWIAARSKALTKGLVAQSDKAQAIFSWARQNLEWDNTYSTKPSRVDDLTQGEPGNSAAINMTLLLLLREAGLDAYPVLISTQDHGPIQVVAANLNQFNHLIVGLNIGRDEILLDALSPLDELGVLPRNDLNQMGYWLGEESGRWVRLESRNRMVRFTYSRFTMNQEGWLTGDIEVTNKDYSAALERKRLSEVSDAQRDGYLRKSILTGMGDPRIIDYQIDPQADEGQSVQILCELQTKDFVQKVGELIFLKPMMTKMMSENPFKEEERSTPIDLNYPLRESHLLGLRIPSGYQIEQLPQPIRVIMPGNAGEFVFNVLEMNDIVHVSSSILLNQTVFLPSEYKGIQAFFDYVVRKHQEDIVLKKIQED